MTNQKKQFGQFFTKNSDYILQGLENEIIGKKVIDPFCGSGDLLCWAEKNKAKSVKGFDIDKKFIDNKKIFTHDSILNPKEYKFVLTNPPYLNINKANRIIKEKYFSQFNFEDLYQISLYNLLNSNEGIIIVPINFLSAENAKKIRNIFFSKFKIIKANYFTQQVFPDTTYNVIAFYYKKLAKPQSEIKFPMMIYPEHKKVEIKLKKRFSWIIGGEVSALIKSQKNQLGAYRLTEKDFAIKKGKRKIKAAYNHIKYTSNITVSDELFNLVHSNILMLKAIDSGSENGKIAIENIRYYGVDCLVSKDTSRHMIHIVFEEKVTIEDQLKLIKLFNQEINDLRDNYLSLFLTNYRDKNRKRISFDFVYKFLNYLYFTKVRNNNYQQSLI